MPVWAPRSDWLTLAVESALDQRGCRTELIAVDDGCPEPVEPMLAHIEDARLRLIRVPHGGASHARNAALEAARGDYLRFVDCDDYFLPGSTARLLHLADGRQDVVTYGATLVCDHDLRPVWRMTSHLEGSAVTECLLDRFTVMPGALLFPCGVVEATGGFDPAFSTLGDWDFVLRALEHAEVHGEQVVAYHYRRHPTSLSRNLAAVRVGAGNVVAGYFDRHPGRHDTRLARDAEAMLAAQSAYYQAAERRRMAAVRSAGRAIRLNPSDARRVARRVGADLAPRRLRRLVARARGRNLPV